MVTGTWTLADKSGKVSKKSISFEGVKFKESKPLNVVSQILLRKWLKKFN